VWQVLELGLSWLQRQHRSPNGFISWLEQLWHKTSPSEPQAKQSGGASHPIAASKTFIGEFII